MNILGLHLGHDSCACVIKDDRLVSVIERERLTRIKYDRGFCPEMVDEALRLANIRFKDIDYVAVSICSGQMEGGDTRLDDLWGLSIFKNGKPYRKGPRQLNPWACEDGIKVTFDNIEKPAYQVQHHVAHIASSFYVSNFDKAAGLSYDGSGPPANQISLVCQCYGTDIEVDYVPQINIGPYYGIIARWVFGSWYHSGKIMGLSAYGEPDYFNDYFIEKPDIDAITRNMRDYFPARSDFGSTWDTNVSKNASASIQTWLEKDIQRAVGKIQKKHGKVNLVISGGCALNVIANRWIFDQQPVFMSPFVKDSGIAVGGALYVLHHIHKKPRQKYTTKEICFLGRGEDVPISDQVIIETVQRLANEGIVLWHQGRAEIGPRALTHRSIFADPRTVEMRDRVSIDIKGREPYRPLAPIITEEDCQEYFDIEPNQLTELMLIEAKVLKSTIPAVTHINNTARVQTISKEFNPAVHELLTEFKKLTGVPVLINTSLNIQGQAICDTPRDTMWTFKNCIADFCVIDGKTYIKK